MTQVLADHEFVHTMDNWMAEDMHGCGPSYLWAGATIEWMQALQH